MKRVENSIEIRSALKPAISSSKGIQIVSNFTVNDEVQSEEIFKAWNTTNILGGLLVEIKKYLEDPTYKDFCIRNPLCKELALGFESFLPIDNLDYWFKVVEELKPTYAIVPDCQFDYNKTIELFEKVRKDPFFDSFFFTRKVGVVQGTTLEEYEACAKHMFEFADVVAIPAEIKCMEYIEDHLLLGRSLLISDLIIKGIWKKDKPVVLLGCVSVQEMLNPVYKTCSNIEYVFTNIINGIGNMEVTIDNPILGLPFILSKYLTSVPKDVHSPIIIQDYKAFGRMCDRLKE